MPCSLTCRPTPTTRGCPAPRATSKVPSSRFRRPPRAYSSDPPASGGVTPARDGAPSTAQHGGTWVKSGEASFVTDDEAGYESAVRLGTGSHESAQRTTAAADSNSPAGSAPRPRAQAHEAGPATASCDLDGNSDMEEWVMAAGYEAPGCWQEPAPADGSEGNPEAALQPAYDQQQQQAGPEPAQEFGLSSSGSHPGSAALTQDSPQGDWLAGAPEDELLNTRDSRLASVDGMVGNWEFDVGSSGEDPDAAVEAGLAVSEDYTSLLAELQQLEVAAGVPSRPTGAGAAGSGSDQAEEGGGDAHVE